MRFFFTGCFLCLLVACNNGSNNKRPSADSGASQQDTAMVKTNEPVTATRIIESQLPSVIRFKGKLQEAWQWTDKSGENILITSIVEPFDDKQKDEYGEEGQTAELHAFHFIKKESDWKLLWKISDGEKACPFDITAGFIKNATTITDLDGNGIAETTVQYKLACRSDVSPARMKLIMHEDSLKYSLRGYMWIQAAENEKFTLKEDELNLEKQPKTDDEFEGYRLSMGRYETEKEFSKATPAFLIHAKKQWFRYAVETFE
jgi:hypothetical protein